MVIIRTLAQGWARRRDIGHIEKWLRPTPGIAQRREGVLSRTLPCLDVLFFFLVSNPLPDGACEKQVIQHRDQP